MESHQTRWTPIKLDSYQLESANAKIETPSVQTLISLGGALVTNGNYVGVSVNDMRFADSHVIVRYLTLLTTHTEIRLYYYAIVIRHAEMSK